MEFLRYPQLIPCLFNDNEFGPPLDFTPTSSWPWVDHSVSGLLHVTRALFRLGFPSASYLPVLNLATYNNSPDRSTKSTISDFNVLYLLVNIGFQVLFHSPPGVLFTFPSQYFSTIGHQVVFSLRGWSPCLHTEFLVLRATLDTDSLFDVSLTGLSPSLVELPSSLQLHLIDRLLCPKPQKTEVFWFRLFLVRSPLLKESFSYFLFLRVLRCFSSPRLPSIYYVFIYGYLNIYFRWVSPFGFPRIKAYLQLPVDYRSLSRPSSALGA